jgi:Cu/Ag efflux protein CusF
MSDRFPPFAPAAMLMLLAFALLACGKASAPAPAAPQGQVYTVRGEVESIDISDPGHPQMKIHHEAIDGFVGISGEPAPMGSMTMPFELAPGVATDGIQPGDKVAFDYRVDWGARYAKIEKLEKLPAATELKFGAAMPAGMEMPAGAAKSADGATSPAAARP